MSGEVVCHALNAGARPEGASLGYEGARQIARTGGRYTVLRFWWCRGAHPNRLPVYLVLTDEWEGSVKWCVRCCAFGLAVVHVGGCFIAPDAAAIAGRPREFGRVCRI